MDAQTSAFEPHAVDRDCWPPDYPRVYEWRLAQIKRIRSDAANLVGAKEYYRTRPVEFILHWCDTLDPRNAGRMDATAYMPFILFPRQVELVEFLMAMLNDEECGLVEKCRDMGATWVCCALSIWLWLFWPGVSVGWGSRHADLVDKIGEPDSIFEKMRIIVRRLPKDFLPKGFDESKHMLHMRFVNPENGSSIAGEIGDNIGRGGRKRIYFKDESAHYSHAESIEAALGDNTRVQIDISSVNGLGNVFHRKREAGIEWPGRQKGRTHVFVMAWQDHPAKDQDWYDRRRQKAVDEGLLRKFAQEVDRNYASSLDGIIIKPEWVEAAVDADKALGFDDSGPWGAALDVADEGLDTNALAKRKGVCLKSLSEWGERDTGATARRAVGECTGIGYVELQYDCIGVGAGVKAETNRLVEDGLMPAGIVLVPWNAGGKVLYKKQRVVEGDPQSPKNEDFYGNVKAQAWWSVARRFERTYRARNERGFTWSPDELISIPSDLPLLRKLQKELCQATIGRNGQMKLIVNKVGDGMKSPNTADALVMCYYPLPISFQEDASMGTYGN